jgi:hypothetical protein
MNVVSWSPCSETVSLPISYVVRHAEPRLALEAGERLCERRRQTSWERGHDHDGELTWHWCERLDGPLAGGLVRVSEVVDHPQNGVSVVLLAWPPSWLEPDDAAPIRDATP